MQPSSPSGITWMPASARSSKTRSARRCSSAWGSASAARLARFLDRPSGKPRQKPWKITIFHGIFPQKHVQTINFGVPSGNCQFTRGCYEHLFASFCTHGGFHSHGATPKWTVYSGKSHLEMDDDCGWNHVRKPPHKIIYYLYEQPTLILIQSCVALALLRSVQKPSLPIGVLHGIHVVKSILFYTLFIFLLDKMRAHETRGFP